MKISLGELALIAGTRGMLGVGIGLLVAKKLTENRRLTVGRALLAIGAASTVPIMWHVLSKRRAETRTSMPARPVRASAGPDGQP